MLVLYQVEECRRNYDAAARIQAIVHGIWTRREIKLVKVKYLKFA